MRFVKVQDFTLYHDIEDGVSRGWTIKFSIHYSVNRKPRVTVEAKSPTGRVIRSPQQVSRIMPADEWPAFARDILNQSVEDDTEERLF